MRDHVRLLFGLIAIALAIPGAAEEGKVGIVLLHGKQSKAPHGAVGSLAQKLKGAGYLVVIPEMPWSRDRIYGASYVAHAREMVASGHGDSFESFTDFNMGKTFYSQTSAKIYLSYFDPDGPAVIPTNAAAIRSPIPILWVVGSKDPATRGSGYAFDKAPSHARSKYVAVDADHLEVPAVAADQVVSWLRSLNQ